MISRTSTALASFVCAGTLALTGCSSTSHHTSVSGPSVSRTPLSMNSSAQSTTDSPSATSTNSPSSSASGSSSDNSNALESAAMQGNNTNPSSGSASLNTTATPRGGRGGTPDPSSGQSQITNFLKTNFTYDTRTDKSESDASARAAEYASGAFAESLRSATAASSTFTQAAAHHGYTTVSINDTQMGQPSSTSEDLTVCKAVTVTWHGDPGWKAPAPETTSWCVDAQPQGPQWEVLSLSKAG